MDNQKLLEKYQKELVLNWIDGFLTGGAKIAISNIHLTINSYLSECRENNIERREPPNVKDMPNQFEAWTTDIHVELAQLLLQFGAKSLYRPAYAFLNMSRYYMRKD